MVIKEFNQMFKNQPIGIFTTISNVKDDALEADTLSSYVFTTSNVATIDLNQYVSVEISTNDAEEEEWEEYKKYLQEYRKYADLSENTKDGEETVIMTVGLSVLDDLKSDELYCVNPIMWTYDAYEKKIKAVFDKQLCFSCDYAEKVEEIR